MSTENQLRDVATMSAEERIAMMENYRNRMIAGETLTVDEMSHAIKCIAADRVGQMREKRKASADAKKASIIPLASDDI